MLLATHAFLHEWNEPHLHLPFQPKLVLETYRPRRDGRLNWHDEDRVYIRVLGKGKIDVVGPLTVLLWSFTATRC